MRELKLPAFKYILNPVEEELIEKSSETCCCCGKKNGYIVSSVMYTKYETGPICPWCVVSGEACKKFEGFYNEVEKRAGISEDIIDNIELRTPGLVTFQDQLWPVHCRDGCQFLGHFFSDDLPKVDKNFLDKFLEENGISESELLELENSEPHYYVYKFSCLHCKQYVLLFDP